MPDLQPRDAESDPHRSRRAGILPLGPNAFAWMPPFAIVSFGVPLFLPMLHRLRERGDMFPVTQGVMAFAEFDQALHHLPAIIGYVVAVPANQPRLRREGTDDDGAKHLGGEFVIVPGLVVGILLYIVLTIPIFRFTHPV